MKKATKRKALAKKAKQTKRDLAIELISRPNGASNEELQKALKNLPHSIRGLVSILKSKFGHKIEFTDGRYRIA